MMKLLFLFTALILSATAYAEEANDTTFNVKDKKIVVDVQDKKTIVKVYDKNGYEFTKTREMEYVDGQEVEQIYVGSPLVPTEVMQNLKFRPYLRRQYGMDTILWAIKNAQTMVTASTAAEANRSK